MRSGIGDDVADPHPRRQRGVGILEDDLDLAAVAAELGRGHRRSPEANLAGGGRLQEEQRLHQRRLAAAALADETERLALPQAERDAVHGAHRPTSRAAKTLCARIVLGEVPDLEQRRWRRFMRSQSCRAAPRTRSAGDRPPGVAGPTVTRRRVDLQQICIAIRAAGREGASRQRSCRVGRVAGDGGEAAGLR